MNQPNEGMKERFDEWEFMENTHLIKDEEVRRLLKDWIQVEIDLALAKQRNDIVEMLESKKSSVFEIPGSPNVGDLLREHNRTIDDIISTITKDTKD